jgi:O-6-methylguanine DNA methyltransferase
MALPVAMVGTGLQQVFWLQIMDIPVGKVASYGEIAELAGAPGRARAVGKACNICTVDYMVPCHRVVAAGGLGGYGRDGTAFKEELLRAEGVVLPVGKRTARHYSQG